MAKKSDKGGLNKTPSATLDLKAKEVKTAKSASSAGTDKNNTPTSDKTDAQSVTGKTGGKAGPSNDSKAEAGKAAQAASTSAKEGQTSRNKTEKQASAPPSSAKARKSKSGGGFFTALLSAIIGGLIALFGLSYAGGPDKLMKMAGLPPLHPQKEHAQQEAEQARMVKLNTLHNKIAELESRLARQAASTHTDSGELQRLEEKIAELEATQSAAQKNRQNDQVSPASLGELKTRMANLEGTLKNMSTAAVKGGGNAVNQAALINFEVKRAEARLDKKLKTVLAKSGDAASTAQLAKLAQQTTSTMESQAALQEKLAQIQEEQTGLSARLTKMREDMAKMRSQVAELTNLVNKGPDLGKALAPMRQEIKAFETKIAALENSNRQARLEGRNIALAIKLNALKRAINKGLPYVQEFTQIKPDIPAGIDISLLEKNKQQGLPTLDSLARDLKAAIPEILQADEKPSSGNWQDRLFSKAKSLVKLRPVGYVPGDTTAAVLSRMEHQLLKKRDLQAAIKEASGLKGKAAKAAAGWLAKAKTRLESEKLVVALEKKMLGALAHGPSQ